MASHSVLPCPLIALYISTYSLCVCVSVKCGSTREETHYSFSLREAIVSVYQSLLGDPEARSSAWSRENTHTHTGHYTHLPDEGERERERKTCFLQRPCNFEPCSVVMDCYHWQGDATNHRYPAAVWRVEGWGCWHGVCPPVLCASE